MNKPTSQQVTDTVQKVLKGVQFPASKQELVRVAQQNRVPDPILDKIRSLPADQFGGPQDVIQAVQQMR
jgi:hypothetical protein